MHNTARKNTTVLNVKDQKYYWSFIQIAALALKDGEIVAFPTETVYGVGVHRDNAMAVERIYKIKRRPERKRLTLMIADRDDINQYVEDIPKPALGLMDAFWPGALAIIFSLRDDSDICVRFPDNTVARDLIRTAKTPILTTSANVSAKPAATDAQQVLMDLDGEVDIVLDSGSTRLRSPSTVIRLRDDGFESIRHGIISEKAIQNCLKKNLVRV